LSLSWILFFAFVLALILAFCWALWNPGKSRRLGRGDSPLETGSHPHVMYLPQIAQALSRMDYEYLSERVSGKVQRRVRRERLRVALLFLAALREDFQSLLRLARVISVLSPEVVATHEFERLRLTTEFAWRYELTRLKLFLGLAPMPQLGALSELVSGLSVRIESAMNELGERAALATELASSMDRRGVNPA
jgi:hypothetical protein